MKNIVRITLYPLISLAVGLIFSFGHSKHEINAVPYPEHLPGPFTGGFGEETCRSCHFDYPLNYREGTLRIDGLPEQYEKGKSYSLRIRVGRPELNKAGFQLTARYPDGGQAGTFKTDSDRVGYTGIDSSAVRYIQHTVQGSDPQNEGRSDWSLEWVAPENGEAEVIFNIAANAGNGDLSEFGDYIMAREIRIPSRK